MAGCFAILAVFLLAIILFFIGGWQLLVGMLVVGIVLLVLWIRSGKAKKAADAYQSEKSAEQKSRQIWQQASQSNKVVKCKTCGNEVAEQSAVCPKCGVTLPGLRIKCPKCSSTNITIAKKGFDVGQAAAGGIAVGTVGLAAGMIGSGDLQFACLSCQHRWKVTK